MTKKYVSRRDFLRVSALTAAGLVAASCAGQAPAPAAEEPAPQEEAPMEEAPAAEAPAAEEVTLDVMSLAEYEGPYREVWNVFEAGHPGIKINVFSINEDTAAAYEAKVAGGYQAAIELTQEMQIFFDKNNYEMAVDLSSIDFEWWDRWQFDVKNLWPDLYGVPGPRSLDVFQGFVMTWQYNDELMQQSGLDPQKAPARHGRHRRHRVHDRQAEGHQDQRGVLQLDEGPLGPSGRPLRQIWRQRRRSSASSRGPWPRIRRSRS